MYKKIQKRTAKRLYNEGAKIYLQACKMMQPNSWTGAGCMIDNIEDELSRSSFDQKVNSFENYNCNSETGYYSSYYIEVK